jgi:hypothetical protein
MATEILPHTIGKKYGDRILPKDPHVMAALNPLLNDCELFLDGHSEARNQAAKIKDDKDLSREGKIRRQREKLRQPEPAKAKVYQGLQNIKRMVAAQNEKIWRDSRPKAPENPLFDLLAGRFMEEDFRRMKAAGQGEQIVKIVSQAAQAGDRRPLDVLIKSYEPLVAPVMLQAFERDYIEASQADALATLQELEELERAAEEVVHRVEYVAGKMIADAERAGEILPLPAGERAPSPVAHLSDSEKASLVSEIGATGFQAVLKGDMALPPAFWSEPAKEAFAANHGGEAWEGFLAGTWTLPELKLEPAPAE